MYFQHADGIWRDFPELVAGALFATGIHTDVDVTSRVAAFEQVARERLADQTESALPEIQAWRRTFAKMGLKPTQYRCASESLLRRFRKEDALPSLHPLIDLCNAMSLAFAIPIAVFDTSQITDFIEVRYAAGDEDYQTFSGETEHPAAGEVIFADGANRAHARRWTNRQSGLSAVREATSSVLIVTEAMHESAATDVTRLVETIAEELNRAWSITSSAAMLSATSPRFAHSELHNG